VLTRDRNRVPLDVIKALSVLENCRKSTLLNIVNEIARSSVSSISISGVTWDELGQLTSGQLLTTQIHQTHHDVPSLERAGEHRGSG
jgi:hypothetical protein